MHWLKVFIISLVSIFLYVVTWNLFFKKKENAETPQHAKWEPEFNQLTGRRIGWKCTSCSAVSEDLSNGETPFCPHCGAKMDLD